MRPPVQNEAGPSRLRSRLQAAALIAVTLLAVLAIAAAFVLGGAGASLSSNLRPSASTARLVASEVSTPPAGSRLEPTYVLVIAGSETVGRARTLMLVRLDAEGERASALWIPPDLQTASGRSLAEAYEEDGPATAIRDVRQVTGCPVHHYVAFDYGDADEAIDAMGGLRLEADRLPDGLVAASPDGGEAAVEGGDQRVLATGEDGTGTITIGGRELLAYAEQRSVSRQDASERRTVVAEVIRQAVDRLASPNGLALLLAASECAETDMAADELLALTSAIKAAGSGKLVEHRYPGARRDGEGGTVLVPDEKKAAVVLRRFSGGS